MYKRLKAYIEQTEALLAADDPATNWDEALRTHLAQISFFMHERLVHLLVTLAFAFMELAAALVTMLSNNMLALALMVLFLVLLVPYIVHYYHLENGTQRLYNMYDRMTKKARSDSWANDVSPHERNQHDRS